MKGITFQSQESEAFPGTNHKQMKKLSIIIPCLNESAHLPGLLEALQVQTRPPDEIIVADAGSKDDIVPCL